MRTRLAVVVVLLLALVGTASMGSASSLPVHGGIIDTETASRPCADGASATGPSTATAAQTAVRLTVPAGCVGRDVQVTVVDQAGVAHSSAVVAMTAQTMDVPVSGYVGAAALTVGATVDGWNLTTTWSYTPPAPYVWCTVVTPGSPATCTAAVTLRTTAAGVRYWDVVVSTTSPTPVRWEVGFDLTNPFYGAVTRLGNSDLDGYADGGQYSWGDREGWFSGINDVVRQNCGGAPLRVRGVNSAPAWDPANNFRDVRAGQDRRFSLVVNETQSGYDDVKRPGSCT